MVTITESENFDELKVIIDGKDDYAIIRFALRAFVNIRINDMSPEDRLLDAIFGGNRLQRIQKAARNLLKQLHNQEKLLPLFIEANKVAQEEELAEL